MQVPDELARIAADFLLHSSPFGVALLDAAGLVLGRTGALAASLEPGRAASDDLPVLHGLEEDMAEIAAGRGEALHLPNVNLSNGEDGTCFVSLFIAPAAEAGRLLLVLKDTTETSELHREVQQRRNDLDRANEQLRRSQAELTVAMEAAEQANRAKSAFLANMSHELRTPMNAVLGYSEMLIEEMREEGDDAYVPDLEKVHAAGRHLLALINDVLDLSKIEAGRMDLYLERFDLREMLDEAVATVIPLVEKNRNRLVLDLPGDLGSVRADLTKTRQSLFNLMSNAAKFTSDGTITLRARCERADGGDRIVMSVSDSGIGIPAEKLDHIFDEFSQAEESTTRNFGGTGLGLAISRRFCRMMGGDITVESVPGAGSTFTISIPSHVDALEAARASARGDAEESHAVLVIDGDPEARALLRNVLQTAGYEVEVADDAAGGLARARERRPAVIVLDAVTPAVDGWLVLRELKADPGLRDVPVVMVFIFHSKGMAFSMGTAEYLTKPVDRASLLEQAARNAPAGRDGCVLVVEDDPAAREVVARTLGGAGWRVVEAEDGKEGLGRLASDPPDLVVVDLMMPVMDGFDFLRALRATDAGRSIPVLVLTAKDLTPDERRFLDEQAVRILADDARDLAEAMAQVVDSVALHLPRRG